MEDYRNNTNHIISRLAKQKEVAQGKTYLWEGVVDENVEKAEIASRDLIDKSMENEKLLNDLHTINGEVSESMRVTTDITQKLSNAVEEIGVTLNFGGKNK